MARTSSPRIKAHLGCWLLCNLIEQVINTAPHYTSVLSSERNSPQEILRSHLLNTIDFLIDTSEFIQVQKRKLVKDLELEAKVQQSILWYEIKKENNDGQYENEIFSREIIKEVILMASLELGLFFRFLEGYFGLRFKAALTKAVMNDKYYFMLNPPLRNFEPEDASGPIFRIDCCGDLEGYSQSLLHSLSKSFKQAEFLNNSLLAAEHVFEYTRSLAATQGGMISLLLCKSLSEALDKSSVAIGSVWLDKTMNLITDSNM